MFIEITTADQLRRRSDAEDVCSREWITGEGWYVLQWVDDDMPSLLSASFSGPFDNNDEALAYACEARRTEGRPDKVTPEGVKKTAELLGLVY